VPVRLRRTRRLTPGTWRFIVLTQPRCVACLVISTSLLARQLRLKLTVELMKSFGKDKVADGIDELLKLERQEA
jgi:hypothetical protein